MYAKYCLFKWIVKALKKVTEQNTLPFGLLLPSSFVEEPETVVFTFGIRSLTCSYLMTTSVAPFSVFQVREKLGMLQKLLSSAAFFLVFFFAPK